MKKALSLILLFFIAVQIDAQQTSLFKIKYLPDHAYKMNIAMNMTMVMDVSGDSAKMNKVKDKGIKLPMTMVSATDMNLNIKTGSVNAKVLFPIIFKYSDITSKQTINDEETSSPPNPLIGQSIYGECTSEGKIQVDSIPGKAMNDQLKSTLASVIDNLSKQVQFPEKPLNIGETFIQEVPLNLPIAGLNMKFIVKIIYKLTKVENNFAFFDLDESLLLDMSGQKDSIAMTASGAGKGEGKLVYDISQNFATTISTNLDFEIKMLIENMTMNCTAKITSINKTIISSENK